MTAGTDRRPLSVLLALALLAPATVAPADPGPAARASSVANAQFARGRTLMKDKRFAEACAAFEQSQRLDPQSGTLYNLAACYVELGKLESAWAAYRQLGARDSNVGRQRDSAARALALEPRLPKLLVRVDHAPASVTVTLNGTDAGSMLGVETPVDPGDYTVVAKVAGSPDRSVTVKIAEEGKTVVAAIDLGAPVEAPPAVVVHVPPPDAAIVRVDEPAAPSHRRAIGIGITTAGIVLVPTTLLFGMLAHGKWNDAKDCDRSGCATSGLVHDARVRADLSTGLGAAAVVALGVGIYLWTSAPKGLHVAPAVSTSSAGLSLGGSF